MGFNIFGDDETDRRRTLGIRDKKILYRNAKGRCQNPGCGKKIDFDEMQVGHKTAWSRGGSTTFKNSVCLCYRCNNLQGTDSWSVFLKKQGIVDPAQEKKTKMKQSLASLTVTQLKFLASKHDIRMKREVVEELFNTHTLAPTKKQYIDKLCSVVTERDLVSLPKETPKPVKRKKNRSKNDSWF